MLRMWYLFNYQLTRCVFAPCGPSVCPPQPPSTCHGGGGASCPRLLLACSVCSWGMWQREWGRARGLSFAPCLFYAPSLAPLPSLLFQCVSSALATSEQRAAVTCRRAAHTTDWNLDLAAPPLGGTPRCCTPSLHLCSLSLLSNFFSSRSTKLPHLFLSPSAMPTKPTPTNPISAHPVFAGTPCGQNPSLRRRVTNQPRQSPALASLLRSPFGSEVWLVAWKSISRPLVPFFSQSERQKHTSRTRWALQSADGIAESFSSRGGGEGSGNRCKGRASNYSGRSCHIILSWVGVEINKKNVCASSSGSSMLANQYIRVWVLAAKRSASWQLAGRLYTVFN